MNIDEAQKYIVGKKLSEQRGEMSLSDITRHSLPYNFVAGMFAKSYFRDPRSVTKLYNYLCSNGWMIDMSDSKTKCDIYFCNYDGAFAVSNLDNKNYNKIGVNGLSFREMLYNAGLRREGERKLCRHELTTRLSLELTKNNISNRVCIGALHPYPTDDAMLSSWIELRDPLTKNIVVADIMNNSYASIDSYKYIFKPEAVSVVSGSNIAKTVDENILNRDEDGIAIFLLTHQDNRLDKKAESTISESNPSQSNKTTPNE